MGMYVLRLCRGITRVARAEGRVRGDSGLSDDPQVVDLQLRVDPVRIEAVD